MGQALHCFLLRILLTMHFANHSGLLFVVHVLHANTTYEELNLVEQIGFCLCPKFLQVKALK